MAGLEARLAPSGLTITSAPLLDHIPPPIDDSVPRCDP